MNTVPSIRIILPAYVVHHINKFRTLKPWASQPACKTSSSSSLSRKVPLTGGSAVMYNTMSVEYTKKQQ